MENKIKVAIGLAAGRSFCGSWSGSSLYAPCSVVIMSCGRCRVLCVLQGSAKESSVNPSRFEKADAASKRVPKWVEISNKVLCYYVVHLACVFGGKKYRNKGSRQRLSGRYL